ncbi:MAG: potassium channel family protein [Hyphomicrobiaceae bacterium]
MSRGDLKSVVRELYENDTQRARRFGYGLLIFDLATVAFIVITSFMPRSAVVEAVDVVLGAMLLADFSARMWLSRRRMKELAHPATWADIIAIASFLAPIAGEAGGFLRVLRTLRLLHTYQILNRLRRDFKFFRRNEEVLIALTHLGVFIFVMTGIVYETQHWTNPQIANYVDALYFTITALTTTGFGDITLPGTTGRLISVAIMFFGVTLFLRLAQVLFRPPKVRFPCPDCGLQRHDPDAVHCKACGRMLNIPDEDE